MRRVLIGVVLAGACGAKPAPAPQPPKNEVPKPPPRPAFREGPEGFPLPGDADVGDFLPGGNYGFRIPRNKDAVYAELRPKLESLGFVIETYLPSSTSHRMIMFDRTGRKFIASVSEDGEHSTLFITVK
jgi:hypothetical protein